MPVIDFSTIKQKFVNIRRASFVKIAAGGLTLITLLTLSVVTRFGPAAGQPDRLPALPEEPPESEPLLFQPQVPAMAPSATSLVYIKPDKIATTGRLLSFTIAADDADGDTLFFSAAGLPEGSAFDADTRTFSWTPRYDQAGTYSVRFEVSDGEFTNYEDVVITVIQLHEDWDVNGDGAANVLDMVLVGQRWNEAGLTGWILEDTNEDGIIDVLDLIIIGQSWTG